jgi:hypothetical protein
MPVTDQDYDTFTAKFPNPLRPFDWQEIFEAFFLDSELRGVHADKALSLALARSGMQQEQAIACMRGLMLFAQNAEPDIKAATVRAIVNRVYAEHEKQRTQ